MGTTVRMKVLITIPVFNEQILLADSISKLNSFLRTPGSFEYEIVIANNASTDDTLRIANYLGRKYPNVWVSSLDVKGRGRVLKKIWLERAADILCYMDADLSTDLKALPQLVEGLTSGKFEVGTGSRLLNPKLTRRSFHREVLSRGYNLLAKAILKTRFSDAQCGFKGVTQRAARALLPLVDDPGWFFDTELLAVAERLGYPVLELPVRWTENQQRTSNVKILSTIIEGFFVLRRLRRKLLLLDGVISSARSESGSNRP
jgi:glycosyltransferase involved in cell wall biosynthesis